MLALALAKGGGEAGGEAGGALAVASLSNGVISRKYTGNKTPATMVPTARRPSTMHSGLREADFFTGRSAIGWEAWMEAVDVEAVVDGCITTSGGCDSNREQKGA